MLDDVEQQDVIELPQVDVGKRLTLVPEQETIEGLRRGGRELIHPGNATAFRRQMRVEGAGAAADVEDTGAWGHGLERGGVRRAVPELEVVMGVRVTGNVEPPVVEDVQPVQPAGDGGGDYLLRVLEAVHPGRSRRRSKSGSGPR